MKENATSLKGKESNASSRNFCQRTDIRDQVIKKTRISNVLSLTNMHVIINCMVHKQLQQIRIVLHAIRYLRYPNRIWLARFFASILTSRLLATSKWQTCRRFSMHCKGLKRIQSLIYVEQHFLIIYVPSMLKKNVFLKSILDFKPHSIDSLIRDPLLFCEDM